MYSGRFALSWNLCSQQIVNAGIQDSLTVSLTLRIDPIWTNLPSLFLDQALTPNLSFPLSPEHDHELSPTSTQKRKPDLGYKQLHLFLKLVTDCHLRLGRE